MTITEKLLKFCNGHKAFTTDPDAKIIDNTLYVWVSYDEGNGYWDHGPVSVQGARDLLGYDDL